MTMTLLEPAAIASSSIEIKAEAYGLASCRELEELCEQEPLESLLRIGPTPCTGNISTNTEEKGCEKKVADPAEFAGANSYSRKLLFYLLAHIYPASVAGNTSEELLGRFGSLGNLFAAPRSRIQAVQGVTSELAGLIKLIHTVVVHILREPLLERQVISSCEMLRAYLKVTLAHSPIEVVRILFLDGGNRLIKDEQHSQGTIDHVSICSREIIRRVVELDAKAIILVHNHPSGTLQPSFADQQATRQLAVTLSGIGAILHDHVIVCQSRFISFRQLELL